MLSILTSSHPTDHDGQENGQFFAVATADQPSTATTISAVAATSDYSSNNSPTTGGASSPTTTPSGGGGTTDLGHHPTNQITDEEEEEAVTVDENIDVEEKRQRKVSETDAAASASINCPFCNVLLLEPKYLQRHFQEAHGLDENRMQREQPDYDSHMISNGGVVSTNNGFNEIFNNSVIMENIFKSATAKTNNFNENEKISENNNFDCKSCNGSFSSEIELWAHRRSAHCQGVSNGNGAVAPARPTLSTEAKNKIFNPEAYCELCDKEFCNKYFLKTHKANKHGVYGGCSGAGDDPSPASMVLPPGVVKNAGGATTTPTANASAASIESQVQMAQNRLASILDAAAAAAVASDTPPLKQTEFDNGVENGEISLQPDEASAAAALFQNLPANFGSNLYLPNLESSPCPFCHQVFANAFLLQSHIFTFHSMSGALPPTSTTNAVNPAALYALMNASSSASFNPFLAQQLKMFTPDHFSMFSGLPTSTSAPTSVSFSGGVGGQIPDLSSFSGLDLPLVDEAKRQQTPPQNGVATTINDQSETAALNTTTSTATELLYAAASSNVHPNAQKNGATTARQSQQQTAAAAAEAFCDLCRKVFCNKYFLRTHKMNKHGISPGGDSGAETANGSPNSIHRKRAYNKTGQYSQVGQQEFGAKVKMESEATNGLSQKDEEAPNASRENDENASINGIIDLALFSVDSNGAKRRRTTFQVANDNEALNFSTNGYEGRSADSSNVNAAAAARPVDLDAYCDICCKEFCSKYFLKQHRFKIHGVVPDWSPIQNRTSPGNTVADFIAKSQDFENQEQKNLPKLNLSNGGGESVVSTAVAAATTPKTSTPGGGARQFPSTSKNFCDICNKEVCNKYYIRTHMLKMHGVIIDENKTIICSINNVFDEKSKTFRCDICGKEMPNKHQLRNHIHMMHMSGNNSFFDSSNQTMSDQYDYHLKIKEESFAKSPNAKSQIPALLNTETRNNRRFKNVSRWLKNDHVISSGDLQLLQSTGSSPNGDADVRVCEYCGLQCYDQVELQLHVIDAHQQEVNGTAEQTALDAICSLKSKNIDQSSNDQQCDDANTALPSSVIVQTVETTAADCSLNLTRRFSRIDETIDRIVAAKEISAAAAAAGSTTTTPSSRAVNKTSGASTLPISSTPRQSSTAAAAAANHHLPMVARNGLGAKMYKCSYCNYYTRWISNLSTHEKRHNAGVALTLDRNDRPFVCRICLRAYRYAHSLKRHMDVHRLSSLGMQIQMIAQTQSLPNLLQSPIVGTLHSSPVRADNLSTTKNQSFIDKRSPGRNTPIKTTSLSAKNFSPSTSNSPQKIAYVCSFCDKQFRNRELYRMHLYIIHKTSPPKALKQQSPITTLKKNSPAKKTISTYNCKICGLSTKIFDVLRDHMEKEHGTVPRIINNSNGSPATGAKKDANDSCNSPLNLKTNSNGIGASVTDDNDATYPPPLSSAPNSRQSFAANGTDVDHFTESSRAKKGSVSPTSDSSENDKSGSRAPAPQPYIMQAFFIKETSPPSPLTSEMSSPIVPGVVYLPVLRHLDAPFDAKFSLFPVNRDDLSPVDSQLENEIPISQSP